MAVGEMGIAPGPLFLPSRAALLPVDDPNPLKEEEEEEEISSPNRSPKIPQRADKGKCILVATRESLKKKRRRKDHGPRGAAADFFGDLARINRHCDWLHFIDEKRKKQKNTLCVRARLFFWDIAPQPHVESGRRHWAGRVAEASTRLIHEGIGAGSTGWTTAKVSVSARATCRATGARQQGQASWSASHRSMHGAW